MNNQFYNLLSYFPAGRAPNDSQLLAIPLIEEVFNTGKKFCILRAPTGSGKTFIGKTVANTTPSPEVEFIELVESREMFDFDDKVGEHVNAEEVLGMDKFGATILTITKQLQEQYAKDFDDVVTFMGKSNYGCTYDELFNCELAPCTFNPAIKVKCLSNKTCRYYSQQEDAVKAKINSLNYSIFMAMPTHLRSRDIFIFDEATELESELVKNFTLELDIKELASMGIKVTSIPTEPTLAAWTNDVITEVEGVMYTLVQKMKGDKIKKPSDRNKHKFITYLAIRLRQVGEFAAHVDYVISRDSDTGILKIQPLHVDYIAARIFALANRVLLMSATIIDIPDFAKKFGIPAKDYGVVDIPSRFDAKKSPIYFCEDIYISRKNMEKVMPKVIAEVQKLVDAHPKEKGIIHTHNFAITQALKQGLRGKRFLFRENDQSNAMILEAHSATDEPTILVSPSMTHGVDLKGDLAKFQIIVKAPYAPLGDERIKRLIAEGGDWYTNQMLSNFIQACGRGTRSETDECATYVIDRVLADAYLKNQHKFPSCFIDRVY